MERFEKKKEEKRFYQILWRKKPSDFGEDSQRYLDLPSRVDRKKKRGYNRPTSRTKDLYLIVLSIDSFNVIQEFQAISAENSR